MPRPSRPPRASAYLRHRAATEATGASRVRNCSPSTGSPRKRMGQNFLIREELAERIVEHCRLEPDDVAVEISVPAQAP
mgnify:CR=1 FL=1